MRHSRKSLAIALAIATPLAGHTAAQERQLIEEITVVGVRDTHTVIVDDTLVATPDTAQLLRKMPGANVNKNGEGSSSKLRQKPCIHLIQKLPIQIPA